MYHSTAMKTTWPAAATVIGAYAATEYATTNIASVSYSGKAGAPTAGGTKPAASTTSRTGSGHVRRHHSAAPTRSTTADCIAGAGRADRDQTSTMPTPAITSETPASTR